jgi:hypothetical protein
MPGSARSPWKLAITSFTLGSLTTLGLVTAFAVTGWVRSEAADGQPQVEPAALGRGAFRELVMGKTQEEVIDRVGPPERTAADSDTVYWHYRRRTRDPVTGEADSDAQLVFRGGRVSAVSY